MRDVESYGEGFRSGALSRREFTAALLGLGLSAPTIAQLLTAADAAAQGTATVRKGGLLRAAFSSSSPKDTLDPHKATSPLDMGRVLNLYNRLVDVTPDLKPGPDLAESWEPNPAGDAWVFRLRRGVTFHHGKEMRAADVVYSIQRILDKETASPAKPLFEDVAEIRADGPYAVRVRLTGPNADLPMMFGDYHAQIVPEGFTDFAQPVGTGPFRHKSFTPNQRAVFERNPNYWKSGLPHLDTVETFSIPDKVARLNALLGGEIQLMENLDPAVIDRVKATAGVQVLATPSGRHTHLVMIVEYAPYDNADVRNALKHLIDRERYVQTVYKGFGTVGNDHPVSPVDPLYCGDLPVRRYDPDRAKFLLRKAGHLNTTFELHASDALPQMMEGALVFQDMASKAGVKVNVVRQPTDGYWEAVWRTKPFCVTGWSMRPFVGMLLATAYKSDAKWNDSRWKQPEFDRLLAESRRTLDLARRKQLYCDMQRLIHEDGGVIVPVFPNLLDAGSSKVKGLALHPLGQLGQYHWDTVWLES